jgi:polyisoprenoid-binding protein YceI
MFNNSGMGKRIKWSIDPAHSDIVFKVKYRVTGYIKGAFKIFDAGIYTNGKDFATAGINVSIDVASISTGDEKWDSHLRSSDFFDAENHPKITFTSQGIEKPDNNGNRGLLGKLTMKGITKTIQLKMQFWGITISPEGNEIAGLALTGQINRSEWALTWNGMLETGGLMVSEEVDIGCEIELINTSAKDASMELQSDNEEDAVL